MVIPLVLVMGVVGILGSAEAQTRVFVSASAKTLGTSPFFASVQQGFMEAEGLKVQMVYMRGAAPAVQALVGGSVQFSTGGVDAILEATDKGLPLAVVAGGLSRLTFGVVGAKGIRGFEDLRGKTLGASTLTSGSGLAFRWVLAANGLQYGRDYRLLNVGPSTEGFAALQSGQIAAGFLALPLPFVLADQGFPILGWAADFVRDFQLTSIGVERRWAAANRPVVVGYLRGMIRTFRWYYQEREAVIAYLVREFKLQPRYAEMGWEYYTKQEVWPRDAGVNRKGIENVIRILAERDNRRPPLPSPERYLDLSYWHEAKQTSGEKEPGR